MSLNGQVTLGKWKHIPSARCLLIDRIQDKVLLNQDFIDPAMMILKKDGLKDESFIMANELLIPDLDVTTYLNQLYCNKKNVGIISLKDGRKLEISNYIGIGSTVHLTDCEKTL